MTITEGGQGMGEVIRIDEARIRDHLGEMVRGTVEETLNALLDAEADRLCGAARYERSEGRRDTRAAGNGAPPFRSSAASSALSSPVMNQMVLRAWLISACIVWSRVSRLACVFA